MSLAGRIRFHGSVATIYRPTWTRNNDGTDGISGYPTVAAGVRILLEPITDEVVQKVFGASSKVTERGWIDGLPDYRAEDRVKVTEGRRTGTVFRIEAVRPNDGRRGGHLELALEKTIEVIP